MAQADAQIALTPVLGGAAQQVGRPVAQADAEIAAIAAASGMAVVTRNIDDFSDTDVDLVNPWPVG